MIWLTRCCLLAAWALPVVAPQDPGRDAVALGRSRDPALYNAFHTGYFLGPSGDIERAEVITEFRRAVMIVRQHADLGEYSFNENNLTRELGPYRGLVTFVAQVRLHPLHTRSAPPPYEMYVRTGPDTAPVALSGLKREPIFPAGFFETGTAFTSFRLEGSAARDAIGKAAEPTLVITNDRGDIIWQARIDLSRFR